MKTIEEMKRYLREYDGKCITLMEVCGSHTAAIAKFGIKGLLSDRIRLVSGPGCPVCVTPSSYIDRLIELAKKKDTCVVTFGDLLRVPGSRESLSAAKGSGAAVKMVYSPMDTIKLARDNPSVTYVFAAVGFETTAPVYTLLMEQAEKQEIGNIRLLTSIKTMPPVIDWLLRGGAAIDGFLAPGHVCAVTGSDIFLPPARTYGIPFCVAGFEAKELLIAIYGLVRMAESGKVGVKNCYPAVVTADGNRTAKEKLAQYFEKQDAVWRGMGKVEGSALVLKKKYAYFDAGSAGLTADHKLNPRCCCDAVLAGKMDCAACPLFGGECTPKTPQGACMVSYEGSCYQRYLNRD